MMTRWGATLVGLSLAIVGCGPKDVRTPVGTDDGRYLAVSRRPKAVLPIEGHIVTSVPERTVGPFFTRRGSDLAASGLVAWLTAAEGFGRRIVVVPVGPHGSLRGAEVTAAHVPIDTTMLVVRPVRGTLPGFVVAWTALTERGESLWSLTLNDDGIPRGKPIELTRTNDDIVWVDVLPTDHGALCLWAEETPNNDANLVAAPLDSNGKVRAAPTRVARGIVGWHALEIPGGVALSTVDVPSDAPPSEPADRLRNREHRRGGKLSFHRVDAEGHATARPIVVTHSPTVSGDIEVVRDGSRFVFAWTDRSTIEPNVTVAALSDDGTISPPSKIAEARGGASLLGLASGPRGVGILFEAPTRRRDETRHVHVARLDSDLVRQRKVLSLEMLGRHRPELAATSRGFTVLATLADCVPGSTSCLNAPAVATLLSTDEKLGVVQREPLTFQTDPATLGWGLTCDDEMCFTLAASPGPPGTPSRIRATAMRPRVNVEPEPPAPEPAPKDGPHVTDIVAIASGKTVLDIATARIGNATVVTTLEGRLSNDNRRIGEAAKSALVTLSTRVVDDSGHTSAPSILSTHALHAGSVAIAAAESPEDGGAIAWVGRDNGAAEVHVTRIDKRGRRTNHIQLTTAKSEATDVTITWAGGGWLVAWVDGRHGNGEVYATKVSTDLTRIAREERITRAEGDASDLTALAYDDDVWLAWADSRESPRDGIADVFVSAVRKRDAKQSFEERRLLPTAAHSRSPHLALGSDGPFLAWIEEAPMGSETPSSSGYGAMWTKLGENGKPSHKPIRIDLSSEGAATAVALDGASLRAIVARSTSESVVLDAVDLSASPPRATSLLALDGPPALHVALSLEKGVLFFNDDGPLPSDRRVRRARISWPGQ